MLAEIRQDKNVYHSTRARSMKVNSVGADVVVVSGIASETGTTPEGQRFQSSRRFADKWQLENGQWRCVESLATQLPAPLVFQR